MTDERPEWRCEACQHWTRTEQPSDWGICGRITTSSDFAQTEYCDDGYDDEFTTEHRFGCVLWERREE